MANDRMHLQRNCHLLLRLAFEQSTTSYIVIKVLFKNSCYIFSYVALLPCLGVVSHLFNEFDILCVEISFKIIQDNVICDIFMNCFPNVGLYYSTHHCISNLCLSKAQLFYM